MRRRIVPLVLFLLCAYVLYPLLLPVSMGALLAILFFPWYERLVAKKIAPGVSALILTVGIAVVILLPSSLFLFSGANEAVLLFQDLTSSGFLSSGSAEGASLLQRGTEWLSKVYPLDQAQLQTIMKEIVEKVGKILLGTSQTLLTEIPSAILSIALVMLGLYFLLLDGKEVAGFLRAASPYSRPETDKLMTAGKDLCRNVILASLVAATAQSLIMLVMVIATGTSRAGLLTFFVFVGSFIPVIGSLPVTLGVVGAYLLQGNVALAIVFAITAAVISVVDNLIRPIFLKGAVSLHPLVAFLSALGGIKAFGMAGIFLGPVICGFFIKWIPIHLGSQRTE